MRSLFDELKRRNVIRVGAAYLVAAWVLLQIGDVLFDMLEIPDWAGKLLVTILALGFPLTLIFAWAFELTPEGLKTDAEADQNRAYASATAKRLDVITIAMVVLALGLFVADRFLLAPRVLNLPGPGEAPAISDAAPLDASVAVLPFENISQDAANDPFTIGIHDDLVTQISKLGSVRTISRTSVLRYRDRTMPVPEIAAELGVATVLEGGVQRAGDRVRINVQLISARSNTQLWAERYERDLTAAGIFAIQSDIVKTIADALQTTLSPAEQKQIETAPTENLAALEAYFLGRQRLAERNTQSLERAVEHFEQAIALDPGFALAYVGLSDSYQLQEDAGGLPRDVMLAKAEPAVVRALSLDSRLGAAYTSLGGIRWSQGESANAETMFKRGIELSPNYSTTYLWYGLLLLDLGRTHEATKLFRDGIKRDPLSTQLNESLGVTLEFQGRFEEALKQYRRIMEISPNFASSYLYMGNIYWTVFSRLDRAMACHRKSIDTDSGARLAQVFHGLLNLDVGDVSEAEKWLRSSLELAPESQEPKAAMALLFLHRGDESEALRIAADIYEIVPYYWDQRLFQSMVLAMLRDHDLRKGRSSNARSWYENTYPELLGDADPGISSENFRPAIDLAAVLQHSGEAERARLLLDRSKAFIDKGILPRLGVTGYGIADVQIHALRGEVQEALAALREAIDVGWRAFSWFYLNNNSNLDSLRDNAEFQIMVQELESIMDTQRSSMDDAGACDSV